MGDRSNTASPRIVNTFSGLCLPQIGKHEGQIGLLLRACLPLAGPSRDIPKKILLITSRQSVSAMEGLPVRDAWGYVYHELRLPFVLGRGREK